MVDKPIRKIIWTSQSLRDMGQLLKFYKDTVSFEMSEIIEQRFVNAIISLTKFNSGRPSRMIGLYEKSVAKTPYIIAYRLINDDSLQIIGLIHSSQHWTSHDFPQA